MHIELRNWADMFIICPLDANTLAKVAQGLCDNLIASIGAMAEYRTIVDDIKKQVEQLNTNDEAL
ncbi:putative phosphopantothenoylcysteine decarboxylase [Mortierella sp. GBA43]|nr:putative phosphopantothenoylcysteine decarboxylase [Mortierella sp. GBA43]